jgi:hypothetical protein
MLDLYYHLHDEDSQKDMLAPANSGIIGGCFSGKNLTFEDNLRATESKIEKTLQVPQVKELVTTISQITDRVGFEAVVGTCTPMTV